MELASFVHEAYPDVLEQVAALLAQDPIGVTPMGVSALLLWCRRLLPTAATSPISEA